MAKRMITFQGKTMHLAAWARHYNLGESTLWSRLKRGETMQEAVFASTNDKSKPIGVGTQALTPKQIAKAAGISVGTVYVRKKRGWKGEELLRESCVQRELTAFGQTKLCTEWAQEYHIATALIHDRLRRGWTAEDAIGAPRIEAGASLNMSEPEAFGRKQTLVAWCKEFNISLGTVKGRLRNGLSLELALKIRPKKNPPITIGDKTQSLNDWARETGIPENTIRYRYNQGATGEDLIRRAMGKLIKGLE